MHAHPDCRKEFEEFENISLSDFEADEDFFSMKSDLKKPYTLSDQKLFDYTEGNLGTEQKANADKILFENSEKIPNDVYIKLMDSLKIAYETETNLFEIEYTIIKPFLSNSFL